MYWFTKTEIKLIRNGNVNIKKVKVFYFMKIILSLQNKTNMNVDINISHI